VFSFGNSDNYFNLIRSGASLNIDFDIFKKACSPDSLYTSSLLGKVESMAEKSKKTLEAKKAELEIMAKKMQGEMTMATEEAKKAMYEEYQKKMFEVQQLAQEYQKKIQQKDVSVQASFVDKIKLIVAKISKKKGYTVVLAKENLLFTSGANDITLDVIKAYNSK